MKQFISMLMDYFAMLVLSRCKEFNRRQDVKNSRDVQSPANLLATEGWYLLKITQAKSLSF